MEADQQAVTSEHDATKSAGSFDGNEKETAPRDAENPKMRLDEM
jgi:hypothetical protein